MCCGGPHPIQIHGEEEPGDAAEYTLPRSRGVVQVARKGQSQRWHHDTTEFRGSMVSSRGEKEREASASPLQDRHEFGNDFSPESRPLLVVGGVLRWSQPKADAVKHTVASSSQETFIAEPLYICFWAQKWDTETTRPIHASFVDEVENTLRSIFEGGESS
jgi:hypothetical protein